LRVCVAGGEERKRGREITGGRKRGVRTSPVNVARHSEEKKKKGDPVPCEV
jgi:hypothetical protein